MGVKVNVYWEASEELRSKEFLETGAAGPSERKAVFDASELSPEQRKRLLAIIGKPATEDDRLVHIHIQRKKVRCDENIHGWTWQGIPLFVEPSIESVLAIAEEINRCDREAKNIEIARSLERIKANELERRQQQYIADIEENRRREDESAKAEWIENHGSAHLRRAFDAGYDCQRQYVIERAAQEAPGYVVDFNNTAAWDSRTFPSETALNAAEDAGLLGLGAGRVVWLTAAPSNDTQRTLDYEDDYLDFEPCEAVVLTNYLHRYDLVKVIPD